jgi:hypothetical protein
LAGCTDFVWRCRERNVGFAVIASKEDQVHAAMSRAMGDEERWSRAPTQASEERRGAQVAELTDLSDLSAGPDGTRLIVRREPAPTYPRRTRACGRGHL